MSHIGGGTQCQGLSWRRVDPSPIINIEMTGLAHRFRTPAFLSALGSQGEPTGNWRITDFPERSQGHTRAQESLLLRHLQSVVFGPRLWSGGNSHEIGRYDWFCPIV